MKAAIYLKYGPPEVVQIMELPTPVPEPNEVLVKVMASTVNRTDAGFRSAEYFVSRFFSGLFRPKYPVLGCEFAGVVEAVGKDVNNYQKGDRVFGFNEKSFGGHAEYLVVPASSTFTTMPTDCSFEQAAALTEGAHYALVDIRAAQVEANQQVLVYGATGAIGSAAVQLLKHFGAVVTAVCNTKSVELVQSLGADKVIDYQTTDFTKTDTKYHFIFDAVGKSSFGECKPLLTEKGIYISTELGKNGENLLYALTTAFSSKQKLLFPLPTITNTDIVFLKKLFQTGAFKPVIDQSYRLDQIVEAYHYVESGQKTGNVILRIAD